MKRNPNMTLLQDGYLFPEITRRKNAFLSNNPEANIISLGIGDTTRALPTCIAEALADSANALADSSKYTGYGPEQGIGALRNKIAEVIYKHSVDANEVFVADGAKCDLGRLQMLFGSDVSIAVQDPTYPVYVEGSIIQGVSKIVRLPCNSDNHFFPDLDSAERTDLLYFCSPNNPTGAVASREQLQALVSFAKKNKSIILFDAAYASYIQDPDLPKSIYEIEGAKEVAIEIGSFSKLAGFTGVRLSWTIVPKALKFDDGTSVHADWNRLMTTLFNGASNIAQHGGLAVLEKNGWQAIQEMNAYYLENAAILHRALRELNIQVYGGHNAPYLWARFPGQRSWDIFQYLLEEFHILATPGSGFGDNGEGFMRFSAFAKRENILEATERLKSCCGSELQ